MQVLEIGFRIIAEHDAQQALEFRQDIEQAIDQVTQSGTTTMMRCCCKQFKEALRHP